MSDRLTHAAAGIASLRGVFVTAIPDCLLIDSYIRDDGWVAEEVAAFLGDLTGSNRKALEVLGSGAGELLVTIESEDAIVVLAPISDAFTSAMIFDPGTPLGLMRLYCRQLKAQVQKIVA